MRNHATYPSTFWHICTPCVPTVAEGSGKSEKRDGWLVRIKLLNCHLTCEHSIADWANSRRKSINKIGPYVACTFSRSVEGYLGHFLYASVMMWNQNDPHQPSLVGEVQSVTLISVHSPNLKAPSAGSPNIDQGNGHFGEWQADTEYGNSQHQTLPPGRTRKT